MIPRNHKTTIFCTSVREAYDRDLEPPSTFKHDVCCACSARILVSEWARKRMRLMPGLYQLACRECLEISAGGWAVPPMTDEQLAERGLVLAAL